MQALAAGHVRIRSRRPLRADYTRPNSSRPHARAAGPHPRRLGHRGSIPAPHAGTRLDVDGARSGPAGSSHKEFAHMPRIVAAIVLVAVLAVGGGIIATTAYQAGVSSAVTTTVGTTATGTVVAPVVVPAYGVGWLAPVRVHRRVLRLPVLPLLPRPRLRADPRHRVGRTRPPRLVRPRAGDPAAPTRPGRTGSPARTARSRRGTGRHTAAAPSPHPGRRRRRIGRRVRPPTPPRPAEPPSRPDSAPPGIARGRVPST